MADTTITGLPNATTPLDGTERVPMDQAGVTVDASSQAIADLAGAAITSAVAAHAAAGDPHPQYLTAAEGNAAYATAAQGTDSREWTAETVSQAEAEAGTATTRRAWTAQRVFQAIAAWWAASSAKAKLDGIEAGAQVNVATDLSYTASTRLLASSTGADATLPLFTSANAGLVPASGGGTTNFLRADGTFAAPPGGTPGGSTTEVQYNNAGAFAGISTLTYDGTTLTCAGRMRNSFTSIASTPAKAFTGTWFTGGSATTTKPHLLIEPAGTTSTAWSTSGTGLGVNAASGFAGNLLDLQVAGVSRFRAAATGAVSVSGSENAFLGLSIVNSSSASTASAGFAVTGNNTSSLLARTYSSGNTVAVWGITLANYSGLFSDGADSNGFLLGTLTNKPIVIGTNTAERLRIGGGGGITIADANDIAVGTSTGTKIGTATTQKLGFYNKAPVVQPAAVADATDAASVITQLNLLLSRMRDLGLIAT